VTKEELQKEHASMSKVREQKLRELYTTEGALQVIEYLLKEEEAKGVAPAEPEADA
jgi:hypothetical protein